MDPTLSQLPFFSEERVDGRTLPPRPSTVCQTCWEGPFAIQFGLPCPVSNQKEQNLQALGSSYWSSTSFTDLKNRAIAGCVWCQFMLVVYTHNPAVTWAEGSLVFKIKSHMGHGYGHTPWSCQTISIVLYGKNTPTVLHRFVYTTPGM